MNREQLREKILEHSNSMFPLIDFFNDIGRNKDPGYDKEKAYEDIEKIYNVFMYYREKSEKLEKAFEILKKSLLLSVIEIRGYYYVCGHDNNYFMTKEEYELLKEELKNDK